MNRQEMLQTYAGMAMAALIQRGAAIETDLPDLAFDYAENMVNEYFARLDKGEGPWARR